MTNYASIARQLKTLSDLIDTVVEQLEKIELRVTQIEDYLEDQDAGAECEMSISDNTATTEESTDYKQS